MEISPERWRAEMTEVSFDVTRKESTTIRELAIRAHQMDVEHNAPESHRDFQSWEMDFTAVHANGCPLRLEALLEADDFNFAHDAFGIARHLDRSTGELTGFFLPRFAQPQNETAP